MMFLCSNLLYGVLDPHGSIIYNLPNVVCTYVCVLVNERLTLVICDCSIVRLYTDLVAAAIAEDNKRRYRPSWAFISVHLHTMLYHFAQQTTH